TGRAPDDAAGDDRTGFDLLVGPDLDARLDDGVLVDHRVVADHGALEHHRAALDRRRGADQRTAQLGALADVGVAPDDAAINLCAVVDDGVGSDGARAVDHHVILDLGIVAQPDGAEDLRVRRDLHAVLCPDAAAQIGAGQLDVDAALQHVGVGTHVLGEVADVAPVAAGDVTKDRVALLEHVWEDILTEVSGFVLLDVVEDDRIEQIDARIDGVAEDLAPTRLLEELVDAAVIV